MPTKIIKRSVLLATEESSYLAVPTPVDGDAVLIENLSHNPVEQQTVMERGGLTGALGMPKKTVVGRMQGISFDSEIKPSAAGLGEVPEIGVLLKACGLQENVSAGVSVTYDTQNGTIASAYLTLNDGGADNFRVGGSRGNLSITLEAGSYAKANFQMTGHPLSMDTTGLSPAYDGNTPEPLARIPVSIDAFSTWELTNAVINMNSTVSTLPILTGDSATAPGGYSSVELTEWNPEAVITMFAEDVADGYDPFDDMDSGTARQLNIAVGSAGDRFTFTAATAVVLSVSTGEAEGRLTYDVTYQLAESQLGASNHFLLVFD